MSASLLFYDLETSGLNPAFDQVMQFAAIRTDLNFLEIERKEIFVKLRPDVVPSPEALLTTKILASSVSPNFLSEYEGIKEIHAMLNLPGTISIGYNTLGFDDEFLRFSFYRNLLDMYTHQFANGCSRADIFPMLLFYFLYKPDLLKKWPQDEEGKINLKLENISRLNNLAEGNAHDAMVDVEATLALAQRMAAHSDLWNYCLANFNKKIDEERCSKFIKSKKLKTSSINTSTIIDTKIGSINGYQAPVLYLGQNSMKQLLFLRLDASDFHEITKDNFQEKTWVRRKKYGEPAFLIPDSKQKSKYFSEERKQIIQSNLAWIGENESLFSEIKNYWINFQYEEIENVDLDARLYLDSFWSANDKKINYEFHLAKTREEKEFLIKKMKNSNLKQLAKRILNRNFDTKTSLFSSSDYTESLETSQTGIDFRNSHKLSKEDALNRILELRTTYTQREDINILDDLENYLRRRE